MSKDKRVTSFNTGESIAIPNWEKGGFTEEEYEHFVRGLMRACESDVDDFDSHLSHSIDDIVSNLGLFGLHEYYEQAYQDILKYNKLDENTDIARVDCADSPKEYLQAKAGEVLARDVEGRILKKNST